jgi:hypothetical protein
MIVGTIYPTKKSLRENIGQPLRYVETSIFGQEYHGDGEYTVVGPTPYLRKWFAQVTVKDGLIAKVK